MVRLRVVAGAAVLATSGFAIADPASAALLLVNPSGHATATDCNAAGSAYTTIQAAINAATSGADTIQVCPGTYPELVTVNKSLILNGPKAGVDARDPSRTGLPATEAVVQGSGSGASETTAFNVTVSNVTIDGFTVQGNQSASTYGADIVTAGHTSGQTIANNIVRNGIVGLLLGSGGTSIRNDLFSQNNQSGPLSGTGIYTDEVVANGPLSGVTIDHNGFMGNTNGGVLLAAGTVASQSSFMISNNVFDGNGNSVFAADLTNSTLTRNAMQNSLGSEVALSNGVSNLAISENSFQAGTRALRVGSFGPGSAPISGITATCNSMTGTSLGAVTVDAGIYSGALDARFNWWGSPSGPTIASNPSGTGQALLDPEGHVSFAPFLADGTDSDPATLGFQCTPSLTIADVTKAEGNPPTTADVTVTLNNPSPSPVTVGYAAVDGTAVAGTDYRAASGVLKFASGERSKVISVPILEDGQNEANETFKVDLLSPSGASLAKAEGIVTIQDDVVVAGGGAGTGPTAPPVLAGLHVTPSTFAASPSGGSIARAPVGATIRYTASQVSATTFTVQRSGPGIKQGAKCIAKPRHGAKKKAKRCTRYVNVGSFTHQDAAGPVSLRFTGRVNGRKLAPGSYRLQAVGANAKGIGVPATTSFRIVKG